MLYTCGPLWVYTADTEAPEMVSHHASMWQLDHGPRDLQHEHVCV